MGEQNRFIAFVDIYSSFVRNTAGLNIYKRGLLSSFGPDLKKEHQETIDHLTGAFVSGEEGLLRMIDDVSYAKRKMEKEGRKWTKKMNEQVKNILNHFQKSFKEEVPSTWLEGNKPFGTTPNLEDILNIRTDDLFPPLEGIKLLENITGQSAYLKTCKIFYKNALRITKLNSDFDIIIDKLKDNFLRDRGNAEDKKKEYGDILMRICFKYNEEIKEATVILSDASRNVKNCGIKEDENAIITPEEYEQLKILYNRFIDNYFIFVTRSIGLMLYKPSLIQFGKNPATIREKIIKDITSIKSLPQNLLRIKEKLSILNNTIKEAEKQIRSDNKKWTTKIITDLTRIKNYFEKEAAEKKNELKSEQVTTSQPKEISQTVIQNTIKECKIYFDHSFHLIKLIDEYKNASRFNYGFRTRDIPPLEKHFLDFTNEMFQFNETIKGDIVYIHEALRNMKNCTFISRISESSESSESERSEEVGKEVGKEVEEETSDETENEVVSIARY